MSRKHVGRAIKKIFAIAGISSRLLAGSISGRIDVGLAQSQTATASLDTTSLSNGPHTLTATATDTSGNSASTTIAITVDNVADTTAPLVWMTSLVNGQTVSGNITLAAKATDNVAVVKMEMYVDGALKATSNLAKVSTRWNTKNASRGLHILMAKAYDAAGNVSSTSITVVK